MRIIIYILIVYSLSGNYTAVLAQNNKFSFEQFSSKTGWTNEPINDIIQDYQGFIWVATWSGLKRYDGYSVKTYSQEIEFKNGLRGNKIKCLFEDSKNRLWIGTNYTGLYQYDRALDKFTQFQKEKEDMNSLGNNHVLTIQEDDDGYIWIGTETGLNRLDPETYSFLHFENYRADNKSKRYKGIISLAKSKEGILWAGCEVGLDRMVRGKNGEPDHFIRYYLSPENSSEKDFFKHNYIYKIIPSRIYPHTLWIATSIGLKRLTYFPDDFSKVEFETFTHDQLTAEGLSHNFVSDIYEDQTSKQLWVSTFNGLNLLDIEKKQFTSFHHDKYSENSINNNVIHSLYKDQSGILWIGTDKGINTIHFFRKPFQGIRFSESNQNLDILTSMAFAKDRDGYWIGTNGTGLVFVNTQNNSHQKKQLFHYSLKGSITDDFSNFISNLLVSKSGDLWISSKGAGLLTIPESDIPEQGATLTGIKQYTMNDKLQDDYIMTLCESSDQAIWIGYWDNGIGRLNPITDSIDHFDYTSNFELYLKKFPIVHLYETVENGKKFLWSGSRGGGLYKMYFNQENRELALVKKYQFDFKKGASISNNFINDIYRPRHRQHHNELWIATENGLNILNLQTEKFTYINESDGIQNRIIQSVMEDKTGNIWISTTQGISCIKRYPDKWEVSNFDKYDGLIDDMFYDKSALTDRTGKLLFGGINGINFFSPEAICKDTVSPKLAIIDFRLFNKSVPIGIRKEGPAILEKNISETREINLTHRENVISFEFVGLQSGEPQKIKYAYKLEGFDENWVHTDASERIAHFTNLPYESFTFKVMAANADGIWSDPVTLKLNIAPPFWLTHWAYLLYAFFITGLLYSIFRVTRMRTDFKHSLQLEKLEKEKLKEVNQMKLQFFTNISHELRTPLTLIISPLEQFIKEQTFDKKIHRSVVRMHNNANRLLTMINQLLDIRKSEAGLMKIKAVEDNFSKFTQEIVLSFKGLAKQNNINLEFYATQDEIPLWFDRGQMEKVWFNLLANAVKFTPEGGKIEVFIFVKERTNGFITAKISDTGKGIPESQRLHIFDRFYQIEKNTKDARGGTGIGLALSKSIIGAHHGKIWVEENNYGGSTFVFTMPSGANHLLEKEKIKNSLTEETIADFVLPDDQLNVLTSNAQINNPIPSGKELPLILLVEDNADIRNYLYENLQADYQLIQAADGAEGLKKALAEIPDLIIADISMPVMDGIEMCQRIKSEVNTSHIPIILLTARTSLIYKIDGMEKGADDYVTKPFNLQLLKSRVKNLISSRNKLKEKFSSNYNLSPSGVVMNSLDEQLLSQIKTIVEKHIDNSDFSVEQLASTLFMSRMQLYRKLKALTGKSPNKIIRGIRLQRAAQLLETKQYNVSDVTYMVGYNDLKYFRDQFKKEFGMSPSEYNGS